jgi:hypothetical protein
MKHLKGGNTDIADQPRCGRPRTAATEGNKQKVDELIRQDRRITAREIAVQLGVGHHAVQEMMEILGYREVCSRWVPRLLPEEHKNGTQRCLLSHPPYIPDLALSGYHLFGPTTDHLRGHNYETDEAVHETGCEELERNSIADPATLVEIHRSGLRFRIKIVKDA